MPEQLKTIADFVRYSYSQLNQQPIFFGHGTDNSWDESVSLVLQLLHLPWDFDQAMWSCRLTVKEQQIILDALDQRINHRRPLPYITKTAWFCGYPFFVDERVLIPRSPIAELIENRFSPWANFVDQPPQTILDLCTGSGCIGIACALAFEESQVDLIDISKDALDVAEKNIENYKLSDRVVSIQSDGFKHLSEDYYNKYQLIVSNPPYVDQKDFDEMPDEYRAEPALGLVSGKDGLNLVRAILSEASQYLAEDGLLVVEVGNSGLALEQAYPHVPFTWVDFEFGGHGVFVFTAQELKQYDW